MRKFDFDNLALLEMDSIDFFAPFTDVTGSISPLNLTFAAPQPGPLFAEINGTSGNDTLNGTVDADIINGLAGDDIIYGLEGDDLLDGGVGYDTIYGGEGNDILTGGESVPNIFTIDYLYGGAGNDILNVHADGRRNFLIGGEGDDIINASESNTHFTVVFSSANVSDYEITELNPDQYQVRALNGVTDGTDIINSVVNNTGAVSIYLGGVNGTYYNLLDLVQGENLDLTEGDDTYTGTYGDDTVNGLGGNDVLYGRAGNDALNGGAGDDILNGGEGGDTLNGGDGQDTVSYEGATYSAFVDLLGSKLGSAQGDQLISIENLSGSTFRDIFRGSNADNIFIGLEGDDLLQGRNGNDTLIGGLGDDELIGDANDDLLYGGKGSDLIDGGDDIDIAIYDSSDIDDYIVAGSTAEGFTIIARADGAFLTEGRDDLTNVEFIRLGGEAGTDYAIEPFALNRLLGTNAADTIDGTAESDVIFGEDGNDVINGGDGDDFLYGGNGSDILNGGNGNDWFYGGAIAGTYNYRSSEEFNGGAGFDIVDYSLLNNWINVWLSAPRARVGTTSTYHDFDSIEGAIGTQFKDYFYGNDEDNLFMGLGGDDYINGDYIRTNASIDVAVYISDDPADYVVTQSGTSYYIEAVGGTGEGTDRVTGIEMIRLGGIDGTDYHIQQLANDIELTNGDDVHTGNSSSEFISGLDGDDVINGGNGEDIINGNAGNDTLDGGHKNDTLNGDDGNDTLTDSEGINYLNGGSGDDVFLDTDYNVNIFNGGEGSDTVSYAGLSSVENGSLVLSIDLITGASSGLARDDTFISVENIIGSTSRNVLRGDHGDNILTGGVSGDYLQGRNGNDTLIGGMGEDVLNSGSGNNTLNGDAGNDTLISLGNDTLNGGAGNDIIEMGGNVFDAATATDGGLGFDTLSFSTLAQFPSGNLFLVIDLQGQAYSVRDGNTVLYVDQFVSFENATGSEFDDLLQGDAGANLLSGLGGDDNLQGRDGDDIIDGGAGADILNGGNGMDTASYVSAIAGVTAIMGDASLNTGDAAGDSYIDIENITGSDFDDILGGDANANIIDGGDGVDIASYAYASAAIVFDGLGLVTASGDITADTLLNIEGIGGSAFDDRLFGANDTSIFYGGAGNDRLFGRNGDDELYGEDGSDIILGGRDNDLIDGGAGNDQLRGNEGDDMIFGGDGNDVLAGGAGADIMDGGTGIDRVEYTYGTNAGVTASLGDSSINTGDAAGDTYVNIENLYGTTFNDVLHGDAGNNRIDGRLGDDMLFGGDGNDYLIGGAGNDVMNGEGGNDLLLGQVGADIYQFDATHGTDRIIIFTQGEDLIEFTEGVFDFSALTITQDGAHVNIVSSEGTIIVNNSLVADFTSDDFIFASPPSNEPLQEPLDMIEQDMAIFIDVDALI